MSCAPEGLSVAARARLDQFAAAFDRLDASEYVMFAAPGSDDTTRRALRSANEVLRDEARRADVRDATAEFTAAASHAYDRRLNLAGTFLLYQTLPDRPDDRVRFYASLERAVVGLILWDELEEEDLGALLGPWADTIERAGIG